MGDPKQEAEDLRAVIREAHECIKDLRGLIREAKEASAALEVAAKVGMNERLEEAISEGLEEYSLAIRQAIDKATDAVFARFDTLFERMMHGTRKDRRRGSLTLEDIIEASDRKRQEG